MSEEDFRRVHRLTPLLRFWSLILALVTVFVLNFDVGIFADVYTFVTEGHWGNITRGTGLALGGFAAVCAVLWVVSGLWWRRMGYRLGKEELSLRRGLFSTNLRTARYDRTQAVDVIETVITRIFGLAAVRVETAGGSSSAIEIGYLKKDDAERLRVEVLSHVRGTAQVAGPEAPRGTLLVEEIPIARSLIGAALRMSTIFSALLTAVIMITPLSVATALPILAGLVPSIWRLLDTSWRYNSRLDVDEHTGERTLDIAYGLADRRRQSIRIARIHGVRVTQPLLWRFFGWYEVAVSVAGYGTAGGGKASGSTRILPVGTREQALRLFELCSPLSAAQIERYARPEGHTHPDYTSPPRAWLSSPVDLKQQAVTLLAAEDPDGEDIAIVHAGRLNRRVTAVGTPHIQELTYKAGPIRQLLRVGTVHFDMVAGPARMAGQDLDPHDAAELMQRLRARQLPAMTG